MLEDDAERAREIGRRHMAYYLQLPNCVNNCRDDHEDRATAVEAAGLGDG